MGLFLGLDPGGAGKFGWCVLEPTGNQTILRLVGRGVANHAQAAVAASLGAIGSGTLDSAGIDAPLFWQAHGDRHVDQLIRRNIVSIGSHGGSVNVVNSLRGACLIQGMMAAMLLRQVCPKLPITESHPKALLWLLGIASTGNRPKKISLSDLGILIKGNVTGASDHERDAALSAYTAFAMATKLQGWVNQFQNEPNPISPLDPAPGYWLPT